jgi:penicillin G amidase
VRLLLPFALLLAGCIAHAPEPTAGDDRIVSSNPLPSSDVLIFEDALGVPHIRAESVHDAVFAQGWLHAEERLWQMDFNRRVGHGRLSELFGKRTLDTDRFLRTVGFSRAAQEALEVLPVEDRALLDAYAAGVNGLIDSLDALPPEYRILGVKPEPWTPLDSVVWTKSMAWLLSASADEDALRDALEAKLGTTQAAWFVPDYPADGVRILPPDQMQELREGAPEVTPPPPLPVGSRSGRSAAALAQLDALLGRGPSVGSNNWVVHGSLTDSGLPILSNDPHLGVQVPSVWYLVGIDAPGLHVAGASFPGLPGVVIGHNEHVAWGLTNSPLDVQDLYRERLIDDGTAVQREGGAEPLQILEEVIGVKGGRDQTLTVRISSLGPLVTEFYEGYEHEVALRWTALDPGDSTLPAIIDLWTTDSVPSAIEALRGFTVPSQNVVLADVHGAIGWKAPGRIPRREGFNGRRSGRGWVAADHWQGWVPHEELPGAVDPLQGFVVSANNKPVPDDWRDDFGSGFASPHRARRIEDLLEQGEGRTVEGHRRMQADVVSVQAEELLPILTALEPEDPLEQSAVALLAEWAGQHDRDSAAAAIYNAWIVEALELLARERLGDDLWPRWGGTHAGFLSEVFIGSAWPLCLRPGDKQTPGTASCAELAELALTRAVEGLKKTLGSDPLAWRWGDVHTVRWHHPLAFTPHLKQRLDRTTEAGGGPWTVNLGAFRYRAPFGMHWHASYRQVLDLSDWDRSLWMHAPGQSGVPWRAHYDDLVDRWREGDLAPMPFTPDAVESASVRQRTLIHGDRHIAGPLLR